MKHHSSLAIALAALPSIHPTFAQERPDWVGYMRSNINACAEHAGKEMSFHNLSERQKIPAAGKIITYCTCVYAGVRHSLPWNVVSTHEAGILPDGSSRIVAECVALEKAQR